MSDVSAAFTPPTSNAGLMASFTEQNTASAQQLATVQIQSRYHIARRFPRNLDVVRQNMLLECDRPSFYEPDMKKNGSSVAIYRVPRGGSNIEGVTIRFAEMAARNFGNFGIDLQQIGEDDTQRIYLVTATDYETNLVSAEIVNVPRTIERKFAKDTDTVISSRTNSKGENVFTILGTDDDLAMKRNALISKAKRNLIMGFIPGWIVEECIDKIRANAAKKDGIDPAGAKNAIFDAFATVGVTAVWLNEFIGHDGPLQPAELEALRGYFGAIKEGYTTWAEIVASKDDDKDGALAAQIEELLKTSGRTPGQARKLRSQYAANPKDLLVWLQDEAKKKADTGAAPAKEAQPQAEAKAEQKPTPEATDAPKAKPAPPPPPPQNAAPQHRNPVPPPIDENW